jgi:DHA1 family tetracycline resistance protein-like MFS transporter
VKGSVQGKVKRQAATPFILVTVLMDVMGIGLLLPVLPTLVGEFAGSREAQAHWYGLLMATFGVTQFVCAPLLGALSDRYGRRPVLLASIAGLGVMFFLTPLVTSLHALLATRVLGGALAANFSVANAYVADVTSPEERTKGFGMIGAAFGIGFILGPVVGGLLGAIDIRLPFFVAAGLSLANFLYGWFLLPESLPKERRKPVQWRKANPVVALYGLGKLRAVGLLVVVIALANLAQFILHSTWVLSTEFRFGWGPKENGLSLFVVGVAAALVQGVLLSRLMRAFGERRLVVLGMTSALVSYVLYGLVTVGWLMYVVVFANLLSYAVGPALNSLISRAAPANEQGIAMGSLSSLGALMAVIAPLLGTPLLAAVSHLPPDDWRIGAPFFLSAVLAAAALALAFWHFLKQRRAAAPHAAPLG